MTRAGVVALIAIGCSSAAPKHVDVEERDPAWAGDYKQLAAEGCTCKATECLEAMHVKLAALEIAHGGMDDAPPMVQESHRAFDTCWREGTKDVARDTEVVAAQLCACTEAACIGKFKLAMLHLTDKYGVVNPNDLETIAGAPPAVTTSLDRAEACLKAVTIMADALVPIIEKSTDDMCACQTAGCAQGVMAARAASLSKYLDISGADAVQSHLDELGTRYCKCMTAAIAKELTEKLSPIPGATHIDLTTNCR